MNKKSDMLTLEAGRFIFFFHYPSGRMSIISTGEEHRYQDDCISPDTQKEMEGCLKYGREWRTRKDVDHQQQLDMFPNEERL